MTDDMTDRTHRLRRRIFDDRFTTLRSTVDEWGIRNQVGLDADGIRAAERDLGAAFPADYRWFLNHYWTGLFGAVDVYTMERDDRSYIAARQPPSHHGRFVAFSDDGCGNAYAFPVFLGRCRDIVMIVPLLESDFTGAVAFSDFLEFVASQA